MTEFITINGQAVRVTRFYRRTVNSEPDGVPVDEIELVVMLRGRTVQRAFQELLRRPMFHVEVPDEDVLEMSLGSASLQTSGTGEAAAHRYDVTFRETTESAARRKPASVARPAEPASAPPANEPEDADDADEVQDASAGESEIDWNAASAAWAAALQQRSSEASEPRAPQEARLSVTELAGVEAVLVGLRLEALIDALEGAGVVQRRVVEEGFMALVADRFVTEATPVVGADAAQRAAKAVLES